MFSSFGIRNRLLLAFFGISMFAVLAAGAALYSFFEVGRALDNISRNHAPEAVQSLELSRQAEKMVNAASAMLSLNTTLQLEQIRSKAAVEAERLQELISGLKSIRQDDSLIGTLDWTTKQLAGNLDDVGKLVAHKLQMNRRRETLLQEIREAIAKIRYLLSESMTGTEIKIEQTRLSINSTNSALDEKKAIDNHQASLKLLYTSLQRANEHATTVHNVVLESVTEREPDKLSASSIQGQIAVGALDSLTENFDDALATSLRSEIATLQQSIHGKSGLFSLLTEETRTVANARDVLIENSWLSGELSGTVDDLVARAKGNITESIAKASQSQQFSIMIVMLVVALSLICSSLIVWLYVGRNIIARLTELSTVMESVAGGDLRIDLPDSGPDEIGRMVDALTVFRDTAIEIEENNLREIAQARRRLADAIESISEGFCYFDADDKLIVANNSYREMVRTRGGLIVEEGMTFETLARDAAESGRVEDAKGREEEWIAERLAQHRNPGPPSIQRRGDNLWVMISERRTGDGGTVSVYSDVTELKHREKELDSKSRSMEQLSNQIAKYLSPQVYESILTGKKEVKVASRRRKLTVFFSDIAEFTETADQMESEELTKILNHYLTEMTQIALAHGATIDKYVGDAIVIFFGDPDTRGAKEDALACVEMAIAMRDRMIELQETWRDSGVARPLQCRTGINTGFCTVGNFGSEDRMDYTIIGSGVNLASRLEGAAAPGEILISFETYALVKDEFRTEEKGKLKVKGLAYPVETFVAIDSYDKIGSKRELIREEHPNFNLKMDLTAMSEGERNVAAEILGQTLQKLGASEKGKKHSNQRKTELSSA